MSLEGSFSRVKGTNASDPLPVYPSRNVDCTDILVVSMYPHLKGEIKELDSHGSLHTSVYIFSQDTVVEIMLYFTFMHQI
jgi:hypothetical protein